MVLIIRRYEQPFNEWAWAGYCADDGFGSLIELDRRTYAYRYNIWDVSDMHDDFYWKPE